MNKQLRLARRPVGLPEADTWTIAESEIPEPGAGEFVVKQYYISLDPAMRGWIRDRPSYLPPVGIGDVMRAGSVGKVITSRHADYPVGSIVSGWGGVQFYALADGRGWVQVDPQLAPLPLFLGALGMPGMTAYFGLLDIGKPLPGETILVSGAAGAVGSIVGQIAKLKGCRVVGIAGGPRKCTYLTDELGFDAAIDYKNEPVHRAIRRTCPDGVDVYFDNVGGEILNAALAQINLRARIVLCGAISQYNDLQAAAGPGNYALLIPRRGTMTGFIIMDYAARYREGMAEVGVWLAQGKIKMHEDVYAGIENFNETFLRLFSGDKLGKLVLKIQAED